MCLALILFIKMDLLAFGFLASQEVKDARVGNLGLWDRECQCYSTNQPCNIKIYRAAGTSLGTKIHPCLWWRSVKSDDVSGVTLSRTPLTPLSWGESAGSISVSLQMVTNGGDTEGLFRAAFMESGSPLATSDITAVGMYTAKILNF